MKRLLLLGMALCTVLINAVRPISAQSTLKLPADIIFQTIASKDYSSSFLVRVDAKTQKLTYFYGHANSTVHILSWSPKGNMLAVYVDSSKICILSRIGQLVSCMDGEVDVGDSGNGAGGDQNFYTIAWSDDETKMYYITVAGGTEHLVEGTVATGKTLRTLYDKPDMDLYTAVPSPNGTALLLNRGGINAGANTVNLVQFSKTTNATIRMRLNPILALPLKIPANINLENEPPHKLAFCPFSPKGTYFAAYDADANSYLAAHTIPYEFDVFDASGHLAHQLRYETNPLMPTDTCPAWSPDETVLFFTVYVPNPSENNGYIAEIYKYTLSTGKVKPYYITPDGLGIDASPMLVSPDGDYLLFEESGGYGGALTTVVGPNGTMETFPGPFDGYSRHPFWVPSIKP